MIKLAVIRKPDAVYDTPLIAPIYVPEIDAVAELAFALHSKGEAYQGRAFGWDVIYYPQRMEPPIASNSPFTPASFILGDSSVWSISFDWEHGNDAEPLITVCEGNLVADAELALA